MKTFTINLHFIAAIVEDFVTQLVSLGKYVVSTVWFTKCQRKYSCV